MDAMKPMFYMGTLTLAEQVVQPTFKEISLLIGCFFLTINV